MLVCVTLEGLNSLGFLKSNDRGTQREKIAKSLRMQFSAFSNHFMVF